MSTSRSLIRTIKVNNASQADFATRAQNATTAQNAISAQTSISASYALTASYALNGGSGGSGSIDTSSLVTTSSFNAFTSSIQGQVTSLTNATSSYILNSQTSSFVQNSQTSSFSTGSFTGSFTGSLFGTASYTNNALSSSYSLTSSLAVNSNNVYISTTNTDATYYIHFGDSTLGYDNIEVDNGITYNPNKNELTVVGAVSSPSLIGTASLASTASFTPNALTTASVSSNILTFTKGNGTTFNLTVATGSGGASFPYTGSAIITGSLIVTGSTTSTLGFTGSLFGTSSWAINAITASKVTITNDTDTRLITANGNGTLDAEPLLTFDGAKLSLLYQSGDEGGEILLNKPVTNTTLTGSGITIDSYQNKIRFFEQGGAARGAYIDLTACVGGAGTNLLSGGGGATFNGGTNVDNRLITATGTSPELNGEANLTFNGSTLTVTGNITATSLTGSLQGTASWAANAITASYALSSPGGGGVTINNNTNSYVITATGTANTLDGEPSLTFDGTFLTSPSVITDTIRINTKILYDSIILVDDTMTPYSVGGENVILVDTSNSAIDLDFSSLSPSRGQILYIKEVAGNASVNNITLSNITIDQGNVSAITQNFGYLQLIYDAASSNWFLLSGLY